MLADWFNEPADRAVKRVEEFEDQAKKRFIEQPGQLNLLIVVDKLLTGFDAPPATYLYIDKDMRDHGLFQAICRVNRLDGEDKEYGYVVDYKDLFKSLESAVTDYTSGAFDSFDPDDVAGLVKDRLKAGRERLDEVREQVRALCEPVPSPRDTDAYLTYFLTPDDADDEQVKAAEKRRLTLYRLVSSFLRAYADLANEMPEAGYTASQADDVKRDVTHYEAVRDEVKLASGDAPDLKLYEPGMRYLIDSYIQSDSSEKLSDFDDLGFLELFVRDPQGTVDKLPASLTKSEHGAAAVIENNIRTVIVDESPVNPKYYERMSELLSELVDQRKRAALSYKEYLAKVAELATQVLDPAASQDYPDALDSRGKRALFDNFYPSVDMVMLVDHTIHAQAQDGWRSNKVKRRILANHIRAAVESQGESLIEDTLAALLELVSAQDEY